MTDERRDWLHFAERLTAPVLENLSARRLKAVMPVEPAPGAVHRENFSHLEALGRLLMGIARGWNSGPAPMPKGSSARTSLSWRACPSTPPPIPPRPTT